MVIGGRPERDANAPGNAQDSGAKIAGGATASAFPGSARAGGCGRPAPSPGR
jgi:hypothetical protein